MGVFLRKNCCKKVILGSAEPRSKASFIMNNTTGPAVWIGDKRVHKLRHLVRADCFGIFRAALVSPTEQRQRTKQGDNTVKNSTVCVQHQAAPPTGRVPRKSAPTHNAHSKPTH